MIAGRNSLGERLTVWSRQVSVMVMKEFPQLVRDRAVFAYILYIFTLDILIVAGQSLELHNARIIVNDADQSMVSRELVYRFRAPYFAVADANLHPDRALEWLDRGAATLFVDIPPDFSETLYRGDEAATVQMQVDTSIANVGYLAASYGSRIVAGLGGELASQRLANVGPIPQINNQRRIRFNPGINEAWFSMISELLAVITVACIFLPAVAMVREKERGTVEQLLVSPISPFQVMFAKVLAMMIVMLIGTAISFFVIMQPFDVPSRGSLVLFFALTALYAFATAGIGMLAATFARNTGQLGMLLVLILFPTIMLSGLWVQLESMPSWLRQLMNLTPLRHFVDVAYGILLRGAGFEIMWDSVVKMTLIGMTLCTASLLRFRRQFGG